jgi:hypothetical protein
MPPGLEPADVLQFEITCGLVRQAGTLFSMHLARLDGVRFGHTFANLLPAHVATKLISTGSTLLQACGLGYGLGGFDYCGAVAGAGGFGGSFDRSAYGYGATDYAVATDDRCTYGCYAGFSFADRLDPTFRRRVAEEDSTGGTTI